MADWILVDGRETIYDDAHGHFNRRGYDLIGHTDRGRDRLASAYGFTAICTALTRRVKRLGRPRGQLSTPIR